MKDNQVLNIKKTCPTKAFKHLYVRESEDQFTMGKNIFPCSYCLDVLQLNNLIVINLNILIN